MLHYRSLNNISLDCARQTSTEWHPKRDLSDIVKQQLLIGQSAFAWPLALIGCLNLNLSDVLELGCS